jgi:hypothetical protein
MACLIFGDRRMVWRRAFSFFDSTFFMEKPPFFSAMALL